LPPCDGLGDLLCACGRGEACDPQHFLGCLRFVRRGGLWRHDLVKHFIYRTCKEVGWYAEEEVPLLRRVANQDGAVMDILVYAPWGTLAIDVSGTCPAAPSYRGRACQRKMAAASERVAAKNAMYVATCRDLGMIFTPAVFETTGALHPTLHDLMKRLTDAMVERFPLRETTNACSARLRAELNGAIHAGNATVIRQGLLDARAANLRGRDVPKSNRAGLTDGCRMQVGAAGGGPIAVAGVPLQAALRRRAPRRNPPRRTLRPCSLRVARLLRVTVAQLWLEAIAVLCFTLNS